MVLVVAMSTDYVFSKRNFAYTMTACILVVVYVSINLYLISHIIAKRKDILSINRSITSTIPQGAPLMSSMYLVFNALEQYDLQTVEAYTLNRKKGLIPASVSFLDFCKQHGREYIAVDERDLEKINMSAGELKQGNEAYSYLTTTQGHILLKKRK
jgi:hypothetical protein